MQVERAFQADNILGEGPVWSVKEQALYWVDIQRPTSCIFGGPDLRRLYITSATVGLSEADLAKQPLAGNLFVVETAVSGLPEPLFAG